MTAKLTALGSLPPGALLAIVSGARVLSPCVAFHTPALASSMEYSGRARKAVAALPLRIEVSGQSVRLENATQTTASTPHVLSALANGFQSDSPATL